MPWWGTVLFLMVVALAVWGFISLVGLNTWNVTRRTDRRAEDLYPGFADSAHKQRRHASEHGGEWHGGDRDG